MTQITANNINYRVDKQQILTQHQGFAINQDDFVCISGPSGGGKTTFLNLLAGLCQPQRGEVMWGDININKPGRKINIDKLRTDWISMIFQEPRLAKHLSGWENITLPLKISARFAHLDQSLLEELLGTFFMSDGSSFDDLDVKLRRPISTYSSGQMQRIAIIRSLLTLPKYIFADEILNSVEPGLQEKTWLAIKQICEQRHIGFVLVTHNQSLLQDPDFTQRIIIENGVIG